ncbi:MAG: VOC family protein, partial [Daejeonella sp.]
MKYISILILSLIVMNAFPSKANAQTKAPVLNHIAVYVHDLKSSTAFYQNIIGLQIMDDPFHDGKHTWFTLGSAGQLHLIEGAEENMQQFKHRHLCFSVPSVDSFIKVLNTNQVDFENWPGDSKSPTVRADGIKQIY